MSLSLSLCVRRAVCAAAPCRPSATSDGTSSRACVRTRPAPNSGPSAPRPACLRSANVERSSRRRIASPPSKRFDLVSLLLLLRAAHLDPISETGSLNLFLGFSSVQVIRSGQKFSSTYVCRLVRTRPEFLRHQTDLVSFYPTRAAVCISSTSRRLYHSRIRAILPFRTCKPATRSRAGSSAIRVGRLRVH